MRRYTLPLLASLGLACAAVGLENARTTLSIQGMSSDESADIVDGVLE